jgi:hypothetical protein
MVKCVLVDKNNEVKTIEYDQNRLLNLKLLHTWEFENNLKVLIYGLESGLEKDINKHELPEPLENSLLYGDIIVQMKVDNELVDFDKEDYNEFYEEMFGGFEDIENTEDEEDIQDDDYDYEDGFLVRDDIDE